MNACCLQAKVFKELVVVHELAGMEHTSIQKELSTLTTLVHKLAWAKIFLVLDSDRVFFFALCEGRPSKSWHRCLVQISICIPNLLVLPCGKSVNPYTFVSLKSHVEETIGEFCFMIKARLSEHEYRAFSVSSDVDQTFIRRSRT